MMEAIQLKRGNVVKMDGGMFKILDISLLTPGKGRSLLQAKLKNMKSGNIFEKRFRTNDKVEIAYLEQKTMEYIYSAGEEHWFMDTETHEQTPFNKEILDNAMDYLVPNTEITVNLFDQNPVSIDLPTTVNLEITETDAAVKGQTATNQYKTATVETGINIQVPPFIKMGEKVKVDTRTGEYLSRVKE